MINDKKVKMIQLSKHIWELRSPVGTVLVTDLTISSRFEAEDYVKKYISSFPNWTYDIVTLTRRTNEND